MARRPAPWWMSSEFAARPARPEVFAVLPWRGDGHYRLEQAVRVFKRRHAADAFAAKDETGTLVVRALYAPEEKSKPVA